jgi:hypothetical protein
MFLDSRGEDKRFWTEWQQALPEFNNLKQFIELSVWITVCTGKYFFN